MQKRAISFLVMLLAVLHVFSAGKKEIRLRITEPNTAAFNETRIFLDLGIRQFVATEDGQKVFDSSSSAPMLYSFSSDMVPCFSNSYGVFTPALVIPLGFKVSGNGLYTFRATLLDNFDATSIIRLEDRALGIFTDLRMGNYGINLYQATQNDGRFFLHVSYPSQFSTADAGCANDDGMIFVSQDNSIVWDTCKVYDNSFNQVFSVTNMTGNFSFGTLSAGDYNLRFYYGGYNIFNPVHLDGKSVGSNLSASTLNGTVGQPITFFSGASNTSNYFWEFGDGSEIVGVANPDFAYMEPGVYTVTLTCSNIYGCTTTSTVTVTISAATAIADISAESASVTVQNNMLRVRFNKPVEKSYNLQLLNSIGQLVAGNAITQTETNVDLSGTPSGVYIVRLSDGQNSFAKKVILSQ